MQQLLSSLEDERQRQFRRFVGISAAVHVALAILFWIGPVQLTDRSLPVVETVQLVEALAAAPVARPAPVRPVQAKPPPPPPLAKKILPKQPAPLPKAKPALAKPQPKPEPKPEPKPKEPEPVAEESYEELMDQLRMERIRDAADEPAPRPVEQAALPAGPTGGPGIVDPELARWHREVRIAVTRAWIVAPDFRSVTLVAQVIVDLSPTGAVLGTSIKQSSGNPWFDESVERAIEKASPLPAPPDPGEWTIPFNSQEMQ